MKISFSGEIWYWRGPAPFHFISVPPDDCELLRAASSFVSYGWGMIPVKARIGVTEWRTSLWPKDGGYLLPVKADVRKAEGLDEGDLVQAEISVDV